MYSDDRVSLAPPSLSRAIRICLTSPSTENCNRSGTPGKSKFRVTARFVITYCVRLAFFHR